MRERTGGGRIGAIVPKKFGTNRNSGRIVREWTCERSIAAAY